MNDGTAGGKNEDGQLGIGQPCKKIVGSFTIDLNVTGKSTVG